MKNTSRYVRRMFVVALGVLLGAPTMLAAQQGLGTENGQWTYLGGDVQHTRYTPADEITADNFDELTMLWRFNAGSFGPSTPRATPSYVDGKLITVTGERRHVVRALAGRTRKRGGRLRDRTHVVHVVVAAAEQRRTAFSKPNKTSPRGQPEAA